MLMITTVMTAMLTGWLAQARVRAGLVGAGFGVIGAALLQTSPWIALEQLVFFTGLALLITAFPRRTEMPQPGSASGWTDEAIRILTGLDRVGWRDWVPSVVGILCLVSALALQFAGLPTPTTRLGGQASAVGVLPAPSARWAQVSLPATPTVFQRLPVVPQPSLTPDSSATPQPTQPPPAVATNWTVPAAWWPSRPTVTPLRPTPTGQVFRFSLQTPIYLANFGNLQGCRWSGVGGQVLDAAGDPLPDYIIRLWTGAGAQDVTAGAFPAYGPAGYEFTLGDHPRETTDFYAIELLDTDGQTAVSPRYSIVTHADCNRNAVLVIFVEEAH
jgi:hypothetical protein